MSVSIDGALCRAPGSKTVVQVSDHDPVQSGETGLETMLTAAAAWLSVAP